ncbi:MAG: hypothetical protein M3Z98_07035, partial [Candidatus Dormibacteraeota bacterium]|nr:hypothetical protein [Candidatus Dormibacteraeota bacterium]
VVPVTTVVVDIAIPATGLLTSSGALEVAGANFTLAKAGTIILEGQMDARMEAWDNYQAAPRRDGWNEIQGQFGNPRQEYPFGITRVTYTWRSAATAIGIGSYRARSFIELQGGNQMRIYGGWLRCTWTG